MRLIDTDELLTVTEIREDGTEFSYVNYSEIEDAKVVYDVDKVVERLEELKSEKDIGSHKVMIKEAIDIVKEGGIINE